VAVIGRIRLIPREVARRLRGSSSLLFLRLAAGGVWSRVALA
jgi:hypothetical protein